MFSKGFLYRGVKSRDCVVKISSQAVLTLSENAGIRKGLVLNFVALCGFERALFVKELSFYLEVFASLVS